VSPQSFEFGPAPPEHVQSGRYNDVGVPVLYLSAVETLSGAERAVTGERGAVENGHDLWMQQFVIPLGSLRIADFTVAALDPTSYLNAVLQHAEWHQDLGDARTRGSAFSRAVAAMVARRFDGMKVAGVRGLRSWNSHEGYSYSNFVVFEPREQWRAWLAGDPRRVRQR
jgi:hypothetical protein